VWGVWRAVPTALRAVCEIEQTMRLHKGHDAQFDKHHKRQGVEETFKAATPLAQRRPMPITPTSPRLVLAHFFGRSIERTLLK
jgi:hypothetical protein